MVSLSKSKPSQSSLAIQKLAQDTIKQGSLRRRDYLALTSAMLCNVTLSATIRGEINQVLDYVRMGRVSLID